MTGSVRSLRSSLTLRELLYSTVFRRVLVALIISIVAWLIVLSMFIAESKRSVEKLVESMLMSQVKFLEVAAVNFMKSYEETILSILDQMLDVMKRETTISKVIVDTYVNVYLSYFVPPFDEVDYTLHSEESTTNQARFDSMEYSYDPVKDKIYATVDRNIPNGSLIRFRFYLPRSFVEKFFDEIDFSNVPFVEHVALSLPGSNLYISRFGKVRKFKLFNVKSSISLSGNFEIFTSPPAFEATFNVDSLVFPGLIMFALSVGTLLFLNGWIRSATGLLEREVRKIDDLVGDFQNGTVEIDGGGRRSLISEIDRTLDLISSSYELILNQMTELQDSYARIEELYSEVEELTQEIRESFFDFSARLASVVEGFEQETAKHIKRTKMLTDMIVRRLDIPRDYREEIVQYAPLHDIGKIFVPQEILNKPGRLTDAEFEEVKRHTVYAKRLLTHPRFKVALNIALFHHENYDGTGYPFGLSGEDIPLEARIVKIVDVYDALRSDRPYKKGMSHEEALSIMLNGDGRVSRTHFDPKLLEIFLTLESEVRELYEITMNEVHEIL